MKRAIIEKNEENKENKIVFLVIRGG